MFYLSLVHKYKSLEGNKLEKIELNGAKRKKVRTQRSNEKNSNRMAQLFSALLYACVTNNINTDKSENYTLYNTFNIQCF